MCLIPIRFYVFPHPLIFSHLSKLGSKITQLRMTWWSLNSCLINIDFDITRLTYYSTTSLNKLFVITLFSCHVFVISYDQFFLPHSSITFSFIVSLLDVTSNGSNKFHRWWTHEVMIASWPQHPLAMTRSVIMLYDSDNTICGICCIGHNYVVA